MKDVFLARTTSPKEWYRRQIDHYVEQIPRMQTPEGAFRRDVEPRFNPQDNARLQEGVLPLAWHMRRFGTHNFRDPILNGLACLFKLQRPDGAYPETHGPSFAATAFITFALARMLDYGRDFLPEDVKYRIVRAIERSLPFLIADRKVLYTNQHAAALAALKEAGKSVAVSGGVIHRQLSNILAKKDPSGLFEEDAGIDLGYATLTYSLLSTFDGSKDFYAPFVDCLQRLLFPDGTHILPMSRTLGWIILNSLEAAARFHPEARQLAQRCIQAHESGRCNATHLISNRHILTTLYRLCEAYDTCDDRSVPDLPRSGGETALPSKYLRYFRCGGTVGLLYRDEQQLGYSFYLGPHRILFGFSRNSRLVEKTRERFLVRSDSQGGWPKAARGFRLDNDSLLLTNIFASDPVYSVGRLPLQGTRDPAFCEANQNMFSHEAIYKYRLSRIKRYKFVCGG